MSEQKINDAELSRFRAMKHTESLLLRELAHLREKMNLLAEVIAVKCGYTSVADCVIDLDEGVCRPSSSNKSSSGNNI